MTYVGLSSVSKTGLRLKRKTMRVQVIVKNLNNGARVNLKSHYGYEVRLNN